MLRTLLCSGLGSLLLYHPPPTFPPSSLSFICSIFLQYLNTHIHTDTHRHIPQSCGYKGAHGPNGVKQTVNQLLSLLSRALLQRTAGCATGAPSLHSTGESAV